MVQAMRRMWREDWPGCLGYLVVLVGMLYFGAHLVVRLVAA